VVVSWDAVFDEAIAWEWRELVMGEEHEVSDVFTVEHLVIQGAGDAGVEPGAGVPGSPAAEEAEPPSLATTGGGGSSPPAAAHSPAQSTPAPAVAE
jgi:hypothetical protein